MDECGSSVCGDSVQSHIFDEPDLTYHDLDLLPTPMEDPKGDEGSKDGPESKPVPTVEPSSVMEYPLLIFTVDGKYNIDNKCNKCDMPVAFTLKMTPDGQEIPYHVIFESEVEQDDRKVKSQVIGACGHATLDD